MSARDRRFLTRLVVTFAACSVPTVILLEQRPALGFTLAMGELLVAGLLVLSRLETSPHEAADWPPVPSAQDPAPVIPRAGAGQAALPVPRGAGRPLDSGRPGSADAVHPTPSGQARGSGRPDPIVDAVVRSVDDTLALAEAAEVLAGGGRARRVGPADEPIQSWRFCGHPVDRRMVDADWVWCRECGGALHPAERAERLRSVR